MTNTYYTSLTGMLGASQGLQNSAYNVTNMQSPGFKRQDVFYNALGSDGNGQGVTVSGKRTNFSAGNYLPTANKTDLAIIGQGFFIVRLKNNELLYTRNGEFSFNADGILIDPRSNGVVQGLGPHGQLVPIHQHGPKVSPGKISQHIELKGEFVAIEKKYDDKDPTPDILRSKYEPITINIDPVYDNLGKKHELTLTFEVPTTPGNLSSLPQKTWTLSAVKLDNQAIDFNPQELIFENDAGGSASSSNNKIVLSPFKDKQLTLQFGTYLNNANEFVRLYQSDTQHSQSNISIQKQDGYSEGRQVDFFFDDNGQINYLYANEQSLPGIHVALANFDDEQNTLDAVQDNLFRAKNNFKLKISRANSDGLGRISAQRIESSNVDSTTEFANIVVLQRMFQACSQIVDIDNKLLEGLYKK